MEHNIFINNSRQASNVVTALQFFRTHWETIRTLAPLMPAFTSAASLEFSAEDMDSLFTIQEQFSKIFAEETEAETPAYEHRWEVRQGSEYVAEFDSLEDAFEYYIDCYKNDWAESAFNEGEYNIYDNELQIELTDKTPAFTVEYNWDANINVECEGTSIYTDDTPDEVMESIRDAFYNGDDYGTYTYDYDGIYFNSVQSALERAEEERRNVNA